MRFLWAKASDDDVNKERRRLGRPALTSEDAAAFYLANAARARRTVSREDWGIALGRYPEPGEFIDDLVLEALVRLAKRS